MAYMKFVGKTEAEKYRDMDSFRDVINYITNPAKAVSIGFANVSSLETAAAEMEAVSLQGRKFAGKKLCHVVIAFSPGELKLLSQNMINDIASQCLQYFSSRYQVVCATHSRSEDHIHLVFNRVSFVDFKRYPDRYEDRNRFWLFLYHILSKYNICLWKS